MKSLIGLVLAAVLLVAPTALAQRGRGGSRGGNHGGGNHDGGSRGNGSEQHSRGGEQRGRGSDPHFNRGRGSDPHFNRGRHGRIDGAHFRVYGDRRIYFFDGFWFDCFEPVWPEWVLSGDVYVVLEGDYYVMYSYSDPSLSISISIVP